MAKTGYRRIKKSFEIDYSGHIITCEEGKYMLALPECDTTSEYMIAYEHSPFRIEKEYMSKKLYDDLPTGITYSSII